MKRRSFFAKLFGAFLFAPIMHRKGKVVYAGGKVPIPRTFVFSRLRAETQFRLLPNGKWGIEKTWDQYGKIISTRCLPSESYYPSAIGSVV